MDYNIYLLKLETDMFCKTSKDKIRFAILENKLGMLNITNNFLKNILLTLLVRLKYLLKLKFKWNRKP